MKRNKDGSIRKQMGRPPAKIDWDVFDKLCHMQCTKPEIAAWFLCSEDAIDRACLRERNESFAVVFNQKKLGGYISLRRAQWQNAVTKGSSAMLIWLGKQYLNQSDNPGAIPDKEKENSFIFDPEKLNQQLQVLKLIGEIPVIKISKE